MKRLLTILFSVLFVGLVVTPGLVSPAYAGMFDDDEARKAILDLRAKLGVLSDQLANKADKTVILEQINQLDSMREEIAKIRGQIEVLSNDSNDSQRRQKDFYADLDDRLRKLEPQKVVVDGRESQIDQNEQKSYDNALSVFKSGDYSGAANALTTFVQSYPHSAYRPDALYSIGIAYYARKDYKNAIATFHSLIKAYPGSPKAPDAMLNIASCYSEQNEKPAAKKMLQNLRTQYPDSAAAKTATDRLSSIK